jgi:putative peptidoglycan lipid II flippase
LDDGVALSMAFTLPAAAALLIMPFFITDATMTRGAFTSDDARRAGEVLRHFAWGVPAFVLAKVLTPPFFAREETKRPMRFSLITVALNTLLSAALFLGLMRVGQDGVVGLAIATSFCAWLNVTMLYRALARDGAYSLGPEILKRLGRIALATLLMAGFVAFCAVNYQSLAIVLMNKEIALLGVVFAAFAFYAIAALALRAVSLAEIRGALKREAGPTLPQWVDE